MNTIESDEQQIHTDVDSIKDVLDPSDERKLEKLQNDFTNSYNQSDDLLQKARERYGVVDVIVLVHSIILLSHWINKIIRTVSLDCSLNFDIGPEKSE